MNHYYILGISSNATADEVKQAYFKLAKKYHPDRNKSTGATDKMAEINLAYETLCDLDKRKEYDLKNNFAPMKVEAQPETFEEEDELGNEPSHNIGRCVTCNFVNNSGVFICSKCGYIFDPEEIREDKTRNKDEEEETTDEILSEIICCPQCNEINTYSRGTCWQCGLIFEMDEAAESFN